MTGTRESRNRLRKHGNPLRRAARILVLMAASLAGGCQWFTDDADREVYRLIEKRQQTALGKTEDATLGQENWPAWREPGYEGAGDPYALAPNPTDPDVPESFQTTTKPANTQPAAQEDATADAASTGKVRGEEGAWVMSLTDALSHAFQHSREFQTAKEELYLAALALSLERHLWTPQLMAQISSQYANYGQVRDFDHAMDMVSQIAVEQRLPYGGEVTARVLNTLMRDLTNHVTTGETGAMIIEANIPLLRGAGRVARESRYQAERDLIYAVRTFEQFRRDLAVDIASDYFQLQQLRQAIVNATESIRSFTLEAKRSQALGQTGRLLELEAQRAEQNRLLATNRRVDAVETYETSLDAFKIRLGMRTQTSIHVELPTAPQDDLASPTGDLSARPLEQAIQMPAVGEEEAVRVALKHRLDLLTELDRVDDSRRGIDIAENNLLPDLAARGSVRMDSDPGSLGSLKYNTERTTWRGQLVLDVPLDQKQERNALRTALIGQRRAERRYQEARDRVELQVRRAMRRVVQQEELLRIQKLSQDLALLRRRGARIRFDQGRVSNREVVDAENDLLEARNRLAQAQAQHRVAILEFWRDTGTLRVDDEGQWPQRDGLGG